MASPRKITANRVNAQRSTGPRSALGKAQSRHNAIKHGLAIPASALPELAPEIAALAKTIAKDAADDPFVLQAAMRVAEAAVEVNRVRRVRRELLDQVLSDPELHDPPLAKETMPDRPVSVKYTHAMRVQAYRDGTREQQRQAELAQITELWAYECKVEGTKRRRAAAKERTKQRAIRWAELERLDRYERRALSRRNTAIRALEEAQAAAQDYEDQ
ncbi:hypothetical protein AA309_27995 [Microvirga vignae]|uniref:Uncharacterized protein n=1 Tax=Microvirga vignae TaxID=1225564 RepID=A0A0H1R4C3_9HYPH|nr:hypothetical protein [Microvirga vignae]KLK90065.1 hypothetical protein AA309_27995 [Microvirga vignae]